MIKYRQKIYTRYDMTDRLKQMRDSDILAEKEKEKISTSEATGSISAGKAALGGAVAGGLIAAGNNYMKGGKGWFKGRGAMKGALIGGGLALAHNAVKSITSGDKAKEAEQYNKDVDFYNKRLREAQQQSRRREAADWKNNITNREVYTY